MQFTSVAQQDATGDNLTTMAATLVSALVQRTFVLPELAYHLQFKQCHMPFRNEVMDATRANLTMMVATLALVQMESMLALKRLALHFHNFQTQLKPPPCIQTAIKDIRTWTIATPVSAGEGITPVH